MPDLTTVLSEHLTNTFDKMARDGMAVRSMGFTAESWDRLGFDTIETVTGLAIPAWHEGELVVQFCAERIAHMVTELDEATGEMVVEVVLPIIELIVRAHLVATGDQENDIIRDALVCSKMKEDLPIPFKTWAHFQAVALSRIVQQ